MIDINLLLTFFGSIISLLLLALSSIVWYWATKMDKRILYIERDQHRDRIELEKIKQNCRNRRVADDGTNFCEV